MTFFCFEKKFHEYTFTLLNFSLTALSLVSQKFKLKNLFIPKFWSLSYFIKKIIFSF